RAPLRRTDAHARAAGKSRRALRGLEVQRGARAHGDEENRPFHAATGLPHAQPVHKGLVDGEVVVRRDDEADDRYLHGRADASLLAVRHRAAAIRDGAVVRERERGFVQGLPYGSYVYRAERHEAAEIEGPVRVRTYGPRLRALG